MARNILIITTAAFITGFLLWISVSKLSAPAGNDAQEQGSDFILDKSAEISRDLPPSPQKTPNISALYIADKDTVKEGEDSEKKSENSAIQKADALIKEALANADYDKYKMLIGIIEKYETEILPFLTDAGPATIDAIDRNIFILAPFYYYVHYETQPPIRKLMQALRQKHNDLISILVEKDSLLAGKISTEYIKLLVDDIAKSGRRRNSDFVFFSFADYKNYRAIFDGLSENNTQFRKGFAQKGAILFSSFYDMHRDVGPDNNEEARAYLKQMRANLIELHQKVIMELAAENKKSAIEILDEIISILKNELKEHSNDNPEVPQHISEDLRSYEELRKEF